MGSSILECKKSLTFTNNTTCFISKDSLYIGNIDNNIFSIYLYFDNTVIPDNIDLISASIILFKIPLTNICNIANSNIICNTFNYNIAPTSKYLSKFNNEYSPNYIYDDLIYPFVIPANDTTAEIDITNLVKLWIDNTIENKGLSIYPNTGSKLLMFASNFFSDKDLHPFLSIRYKYNNCICLNENAAIFELPVKTNIITQ